MNFKSIIDSKPEPCVITIFLVIDDLGRYDVLTGYIRDNQFYLPDGYPLIELKPVAWHELPKIPQDCNFVWETI
jgi:hypothetical protein